MCRLCILFLPFLRLCKNSAAVKLYCLPCRHHAHTHSVCVSLFQISLTGRIHCNRMVGVLTANLPHVYLALCRHSGPKYKTSNVLCPGYLWEINEFDLSVLYLGRLVCFLRSELCHITSSCPPSCFLVFAQRLHLTVFL